MMGIRRPKSKGQEKEKERRRVQVVSGDPLEEIGLDPREEAVLRALSLEMNVPITEIVREAVLEYIATRTTITEPIQKSSGRARIYVETSHGE